jgi:UDP-2,3-diacylglucosamine hydrolase
MKAVFFSDTHLTDYDPSRVQLTIRAMREVSRDADLVVVLGDLFEFYHGFGTYVYPFFQGIVDTLRDLAAGRTVYFVEGNHEFGMGQFFESYTGVKCVDKLAITMDGKKVLISHGDEIGAPVLRGLLKSHLVYSLMDFLGPQRTWKIAMACRPILSKSHKRYSEKTRNLFRRHGRRKLSQGYDAVVMAHSHIPDIEEHSLDGRTGTYMNTGDLIGSWSYGIYQTDKGFSIETYRGSAIEGDP